MSSILDDENERNSQSFRGDGGGILYHCNVKLIINYVSFSFFSSFISFSYHTHTHPGLRLSLNVDIRLIRSSRSTLILPQLHNLWFIFVPFVSHYFCFFERSVRIFFLFLSLYWFSYFPFSVAHFARSTVYVCISLGILHDYVTLSTTFSLFYLLQTFFFLSFQRSILCCRHCVQNFLHFHGVCNSLYSRTPDIRILPYILYFETLTFFKNFRHYTFAFFLLLLFSFQLQYFDTLQSVEIGLFITLESGEKKSCAIKEFGKNDMMPGHQTMTNFRFWLNSLAYNVTIIRTFDGWHEKWIVIFLHSLSFIRSFA